MGATTMAIGEEAGGDGATLVDLTLVAEELGRAGTGAVDRPRRRGPAVQERLGGWTPKRWRAPVSSPRSRARSAPGGG